MNVVSMCLYGTDLKYINGAMANADLIKTVYPGWELWVYIDTSLPKRIVDDLRDKGARLIGFKARGHEGMFMRFLPAGNRQVEHVIFRDADSRLGEREKAAVGEWMASGKTFHVMRDHPDHAHWPMLGGMWGCKGGSLPDIHKMMNHWPTRTKKLDDMKFLAEMVWPAAQHDMLHHSSVDTPHPNARPFPTAPSHNFVGEIVE